MPFQPLNISRGGAKVTLDKFGRLRLNAGAITSLKMSPFQQIYVSVDVENKRLGVVRVDVAKVPGHTALKMDKRGYLGTSAGKAVASKLALSSDDLPATFAYIGQTDEGGAYWATFELVTTNA